MEDLKQIITVITLNEDGVLSRVAGLFASRGYNIETLSVAPVPATPYSHFTIQTSGDERVLEQIVKQLHKLIPVLKVTKHARGGFTGLETVLVKFAFSENLADIDALCRAYNGRIASISDDFIIGTVSDDAQKIARFLQAVKKFSPKEIARSGVVAINND